MVFLKSGKELVPHVGSPTKVNKNKKGERNVYVVHSNCMKNIKFMKFKRVHMKNKKFMKLFGKHILAAHISQQK